MPDTSAAGAEVVVRRTDGGAVAALGLTLQPTHRIDPETLLAFELAEREHFRRWIDDRGDAYYRLEAVAASLEQARRWWEAGTDRLHVVVGGDGQVVARANLVEIADGRAAIGYRVAEAWTGRGVATAAITDLLALAPGYGVATVRAGTSAVNVASARALTRCGFRRVSADEHGHRWERRIP